MRITKLELENFKRFTKLTIDMTQLSTPPKLVLLIGANGSGKSSVFDAFNCLTSEVIDIRKGLYHHDLDEYYRKDIKEQYSITISEKEGNVSGGLNNTKTSRRVDPSFFYGRTSLRQIPRLTRLSAKNGFNVEEDTDRPMTWIDRDERFENDVEKTNLDLIKLFYDSKKTTNTETIARFIQPISDALSRIFGEDKRTSIRFVSIIPPGDGQVAEILFSKGNSTVHYNLLSAGEKEVFNILLNLSVRRKYYQDSVYFIDEMDLHLEYNTQRAFLKEITENWIPETCQLWTASHSLGFIKYANENKDAVIIDFDNLDFDIEQTIYPSAKNSTEVYEIAVDKEFLAKLFSGKRIIFAEGEDTGYYNPLDIKDCIFFKARNKNDVFFRAIQDPQFTGLLDRDYISDIEMDIVRKKYANVLLTDYYSIENYLFHPDNLEEYFASIDRPFNRQAYINEIILEKNKNLDKIKLRLHNSRSSYPFFKETENEDQLELFKKADNALPVVEMLNSDDFETFYKVFPAKDYGATLPERQNLNKHDLSRTKWFKGQIEKILEKSPSK